MKKKQEQIINIQEVRKNKDSRKKASGRKNKEAKPARTAKAAKADRGARTGKASGSGRGPAEKGADESKTGKKKAAGSAAPAKPEKTRRTEKASKAARVRKTTSKKLSRKQENREKNRPSLFTLEQDRMEQKSRTAALTEGFGGTGTENSAAVSAAYMTAIREDRRRRELSELLVFCIFQHFITVGTKNYSMYIFTLF